MTHLLAVAALGFFLGMRHATDPDHIVAVTAIVARQRSVGAAAVTGAMWAFGHTLTILVVGGAIILFGWVIPPRVGLSMELSVGLMLIVLGVMNLTSVVQTIRSRATASPDASTSLSALGTSRVARPLIVGIVHGLAGSAAVALLVLAVIGQSAWSLLYLVVFGAGTIVGMVLVTAAVGIPFAASGNQFERLHRTLRIATGALSVAFGLMLAYKIGVVDGLFGGDPRWEPR